LQAQYFPHINPRVAKTMGLNPKENVFVQLAMRPIQLWEIVFPYKHLRTVLATLPTGNRELNLKQNAVLGTFRKLLGASKIPDDAMKDIDKEPHIIIYNINQEWLPFGIKEDSIQEDGSEML